MKTTEKTKKSYQSPSLRELKFETDSCILQGSASGIIAPAYEEIEETGFWS